MKNCSVSLDVKYNSSKILNEGWLHIWNISFEFWGSLIAPQKCAMWHLKETVFYYKKRSIRRYVVEVKHNNWKKYAIFHEIRFLLYLVENCILFQLIISFAFRFEHFSGNSNFLGLIHRSMCIFSWIFIWYLKPCLAGEFYTSKPTCFIKDAI
jgi:hypothetical protein